MDWVLSKPKFDDNGLSIADKSIVEKWEQPIQNILAKSCNIKESSSILEIGYGLGLSAKIVAAHNPKFYLVIEAHPYIAFMARQTLQTHIAILNDFWENSIDALQSCFFDAIIFDAYPMEVLPFDGSAISTYNQVRPFIKRAKRLLHDGGSISFIDFSCEVLDLDIFQHDCKQYFSSFYVHKVAINPPENCTYAKNNMGHVITLKK